MERWVSNMLPMTPASNKFGLFSAFFNFSSKAKKSVFTGFPKYLTHISYCKSSVHRLNNGGASQNKKINFDKRLNI